MAQERGRLRTYLGSAPGVGKTYAMLNEGRLRLEGGERVVVGWVQRHGRPATRDQLGDLEVIPPRVIEYRGREFEEMDLDAVLESEPDLVLVDELAHPYPDGCRHRWQDVDELLAAGISVLTTVNIANLESARDYAARITGAGMVEPAPDALVREGEVELVDLPPEALRRRIAAGGVLSTDVVGGALSRYFDASNLAGLGALARAWMDDTLSTVGDELVGESVESTRPTVVAGVSASAWGEPVIRFASSMAERDEADLLVVHVDVADGLDRRNSANLDRYRELATDVGGRYAVVRGETVPRALAQFAREHDASRIVVARHRSLLGELLRGRVASRLRHLVPDTEVDVVRTQG